jgi:uncharacterized membrane protein YfcA
MTAKLILLLALGVFAIAYTVVFVRGIGSSRPSVSHLATGFATNFLDTLGIGSFATSTAIFKFANMVPDELIPGTLNAGHTLPVMFQAFIYIAAIDLDVTTLVLMVASAVIGAWLGAGLVTRLRRRSVQVGMGLALLIAAAVLLMSQLRLFPAGGTATGLRGWQLAAGMAGNFIFGAISTLGIGFYAPCMTLVSLLGMSPAVAFPIMMGSSAFLMPVASTRFIWNRAWFVPVAVGLTVGGLLGVPLAAFVVKSLPLTALRYLVIGIVLYAAVLMLRPESPAAKAARVPLAG